MNIPDMCAEGIRLEAIFRKWNRRYTIYKNTATLYALNDARQRWDRHKEKCDQCGSPVKNERDGGK